MRVPVNSLFFCLGAEMGQTNHPGSPEDPFYESRGKALFPVSAYTGLLGQVITPPCHKGTLWDNSLRWVKGHREGGSFFMGGAKVAESYCSKTSSQLFRAEEEVVLGRGRTVSLSALLRRCGCWQAPCCGSACPTSPRCLEPMRNPHPPTVPLAVF